MKRELATVESTAVSGIIENGDMAEGIQNYFNNISGIIETNLDARAEFQKMAATHQLMEKVKHDNLVEGVNIYKELNDFILIQNSKETGKSYSQWINIFFKYCENEKIDVLRITRKQSEKYVKYLNEKYAPNSVRSMIMSLGSFYEYLMNHYEGLFPNNIFHHLKLPNIKLVRKIDNVLEDDIKVLRDEFERIGRKDFVCAIDLFSKYGFRVGILDEMKIDNNGNWQGTSKGSQYRGKFTKAEVKKINESKLLELSKSTITNVFKKYTNKLFKEGKISCAFSIHDLRHFVITKRVNKMNIAEFLTYSRGIHKNPSTTLGYVNI